VVIWLPRFLFASTWTAAGVYIYKNPNAGDH